MCTFWCVLAIKALDASMHRVYYIDTPSETHTHRKAHTMNATTTTTTADLYNEIVSLSEGFATRKVTADDVWNSKRDLTVDLAHDIVSAYAGTFPFMLNMSDAVARGDTLTDAQVAGILNVAISDYRYSQRHAAVQAAQAIVTDAAQPTPVARTYDHSVQCVADGWYTIQGNTSHRTIRLQTVKDDKSDGVKQWLAYLNGPDNTGDYLTVGFVHGNEVTLFKKNEGKYLDIVAATRYLIKNGTKAPEYGKAYALRSGRCARCNKMLTVPLSITNGYGPKCSEMMGL